MVVADEDTMIDSKKKSVGCPLNHQNSTADGDRRSQSLKCSSDFLY